MGVQQYSLVSHDWVVLENIINDLARSVGQELSSISEPTFAELTLTGLTASRLIAADADKQLESISALTDHSILVGSGTSDITSLGVATNGQLAIGSTGNDPVLAALTGTTNQIIVTNGAGSITLTTPQDIATDSEVTFNGGINTTGTIDASAGKVLVEDNDSTAPTSESDGYIGVAKVSGNARIYFAVDGQVFYTSGSFDVAVQTGNPIGLLLALTYA